ncbi:MAG: hypothetical protein AAF389_04370 [Gemmatimonadota bacterium]
MFELLAAGALGAYGHIKARKFVGQKLRYTSIVEKPGLGLMTGAVTTVGVGVVSGLIPFVGIPMAIAIGAGAGVGTGVALGVKDTKDPPKLIDD